MKKIITKDEIRENINHIKIIKKNGLAGIKTYKTTPLIDGKIYYTNADQELISVNPKGERKYGGKALTIGDFVDLIYNEVNNTKKIERHINENYELRGKDYAHYVHDLVLDLWMTGIHLKYDYLEKTVIRYLTENKIRYTYGSEKEAIKF